MNESGYRFGSFVVDFSAREFVRDGERIHLQEQPFQLLMTLLERPNQVVTREELRKELWPANVLVDFDHRLNNAIARLREVLGDDADSPHFIETVPRVGYRFIYPRLALRRLMDSECPLCGGHFKTFGGQLLAVLSRMALRPVADFQTCRKQSFRAQPNPGTQRPELAAPLIAVTSKQN